MMYLIPAGFGLLVLVVGAVVVVHKTWPAQADDNDLITAIVAGLFSLIFAGIMVACSYQFYIRR